MTSESRLQYPDVDWTGLIGLRNVLVHAYHRIQPELLWEVASVEVPAVISALDRGTGGGSG
ncbi:MAG TPA: HepT-like ribonuclease domain-containing protein, partial [Pseudonocardiaceae bacterium]|nr:HepT-like ribonuclease domain-containing protein [Pseudonocardiaceae bacterium]